MRTFLLGLVALVRLAGTAMADDLLGDWRTAPDDNGNTGIIRVNQCRAKSLCGTLVQAFDPSGAASSRPTSDAKIIWETKPRPASRASIAGCSTAPDARREYRRGCRCR